MEGRQDAAREGDVAGDDLDVGEAGELLEDGEEGEGGEGGGLVGLSVYDLAAGVRDGSRHGVGTR